MCIRSPVPAGPSSEVRVCNHHPAFKHLKPACQGLQGSICCWHHKHLVRDEKANGLHAYAAAAVVAIAAPEHTRASRAHQCQQSTPLPTEHTNARAEPTKGLAGLLPRPQHNISAPSAAREMQSGIFINFLARLYASELHNCISRSACKP